MLLLLVDTASTAGSVLLARIGRAGDDCGPARVMGTSRLEPRQFSIQLISSIEEVLKASVVTMKDVDALGVVSGPGSFTGLRVGLSAIKGIAEATAKPILPVSRLAIMASLAGDSGVVHAVLDAGRGEFYHGVYRDAGWTHVAESLETHEDLLTKLRRDSGVVVASEIAVLNSLPEFEPHQIRESTAADALPLIAKAWCNRRFGDVASLDANYLRRSNPEEARKRSAESAHTDRM